MPPQNIRVLYLDILLMEFSWQEYCSNLPFPPPVENVSSELFTMTHLSWVALHSMAQRFCVTQALLPWQVYDLWRGLSWWRDLHNSVKCWAMPWRATQDRQVKVYSYAEGDSKPLPSFCLKYPITNMKRQKDMILEDEIQR